MDLSQTPWLWRIALLFNAYLSPPCVSAKGQTAVSFVTFFKSIHGEAVGIPLVLYLTPPTKGVAFFFFLGWLRAKSCPSMSLVSVKAESLTSQLWIYFLPAVTVPISLWLRCRKSPWVHGFLSFEVQRCPKTLNIPWKKCSTRYLLFRNEYLIHY